MDEQMESQWMSRWTLKVASSAILKLTNQLYVNLLSALSINREEVMVVDLSPIIWMTPILQYLKDKIISRLQNRAEKYIMLNGSVLWKSFTNMEVRTLLVCLLTNKQVCSYNIHKGECNNHLERRSLELKAI